MMHLINLLEGLIAVWTISEVCDIGKKYNFIITTTFLTFMASCVCDFLLWNSWPLLVAYTLIWFVMSSIYTKKSIVYNFFVSVVCNYIINISLIFPLLFLYEEHFLFGCLMIRVIQAIISYLFVVYRKRYGYIENKYWIPVLIVLLCCMIILEEKIYAFFSGPLSVVTLTVIFLTFIIAGVSLMFFFMIEKILYDKECVYKQLERERYRNISYDIINYAKRELDYLHHGLIYRLMLIRGKLDNASYEEANQILMTYIDDINKYSYIVTTGNELFDVFFTMTTSNINFELVKNINIPQREFYNSIEFINLISMLLSVIENESVVHFTMEDKGNLCVISLSSTRCFYNKNALDGLLKKCSSNSYLYDLSESQSLCLLKLIMRVNDEKNM